MKKIIAAAFLSFVFFSCTDTKKQEKDLLGEVITLHDQVMAKDERVMNDKMQLDTLIMQNKSAAINAEATSLTAKLDSADTRMEDWMHHFDAENKGKSHEQIMSYLADQKKQIAAIDKLISATLTSSGKFIKQNKTK